MKIEFIQKLEKKFDIEIVPSIQASNWENCFDTDEDDNIISLHLYDVSVDSLNFLVSLEESLKQLSVVSAKIRDISIIKTLNRLEYLNLDFNPILTKSLSNLNGLTRLKELHLGGTNIRDTSILGDIKSLEALFLGPSDFLESVNGLEKLTNLTQLDLNHTEIRSLENIHVNKSLRFLSIESSIDKISGLDRYPNIEELNLMSSGIKTIEGLNQLKSLKKLNLFGSNLSEIHGLENQINLEVLDLGDNQIAEISGLENLKKLRRLSLGFNELKTVTNLDGLSELEYILLDGNYITKFDSDFLTGLKNNCTISLCNNPIKYIQGKTPDNVRVEFESKYSIYRTLF